MKLGLALKQVQDAEQELASELLKVGDRHAVDHELHHTAHRLAEGCAVLTQRLRPFGERYGTEIDEAEPDSPGLLERTRQLSSELLGRSPASGMLLLRDLRELWLAAQAAEISWVILAQAAQAARDSELLELATEGHDEAEVRGKWIRTHIKESAPQVLVAG
jgi:hypothetical protein